MSKKRRDKNEQSETTPKPKAPSDTTPSSRAESDEPFPNQALWFATLMIVSVIFRIALLLYSQKFLQSDEALVGMIALDIAEGKPIPIFPYGNDYAGGHIFEALLMVPGLKLVGPSGVVVAGVPAMISCLYLAVAYFALYRFWGKRLALVATTFFSFSCAFVTYNYYVNGSMTTMLFSWIGMAFFLEFFLGEKERPLAIFFSGLALGFAYYCFDYALFYIFLVGLLWALKEKWRIWRQSLSFVCFFTGLGIGASPLIYYNMNNGWRNFENLFVRTAGRNEKSSLEQFFTKFLNLFTHDLPAFFSIEIYDFAERISWLSYAAHALFMASCVYLIWRKRRTVGLWLRSLFKAQTPALERQDRPVYFILFMLIYMCLYCASFSGGKAPRYLLPLYPFVPAVMAWAFLDIIPRFPKLAWSLLAIFAITQVWFLGILAADRTTTEWRITTHGEEIETLANYLESNHMTTVMTPYEIKWKLMFHTNRRILCASYMFQFDRQNSDDPNEDYNLKVVERVENEGAPLTLVLDREWRMPRIVEEFQPGKSFKTEEFFAILKLQGITFEETKIGRDYTVYHHFNPPLSLVALSKWMTPPQ